MAIIFSGGLTIPSTPSEIEKGKKAHIGYTSVVTADNVVASSSEAGRPVTNLANPLTAEDWKATTDNSTITVDAGSAVDVEYIGVAAHTLGTNGCTCTLAYSTDDITYTDIIGGPIIDNKPIMIIFETIQARFWRISMVANAPVSIGVLNIGQVLVMQRGIYGGHTPITMGRNTKVIRNKTEGGQFAGVSIINEGVKTSYEWKNLTADWYRANFDPFVVAARSRPFFIAWRPYEFPLEVGYVWTDGDIVPSNNGTRNLIDVSMKVNGFSDE